MRITATYPVRAYPASSRAPSAGPPPRQPGPCPSWGAPRSIAAPLRCVWHRRLAGDGVWHRFPAGVRVSHQRPAGVAVAAALRGGRFWCGRGPPLLRRPRLRSRVCVHQHLHRPSRRHRVPGGNSAVTTYAPLGRSFRQVVPSAGSVDSTDTNRAVRPRAPQARVVRRAGPDRQHRPSSSVKKTFRRLCRAG